MINIRDHFRLRRQMDVDWSVLEQKVLGKGKIYNISVSGMSFETDRVFTPEHGMIIGFSSHEILPLPKNGKLVWFKKVGDPKRSYQCGIKFKKELVYSPSWVKWMEDNILKLADTGDNKILNKYLSASEEE